MGEPTVNRDPLEVLAAEFMERCRRGEHPSIDEYAEQHPELAGEIRELFPTIATVEQFKGAGSDHSGRGPVRGDVQLERLGDFRIIRELGRGGMGIVYEAEQESLGRRVAVKVLPRQMLLAATQLDRFECEARTAAKLHHTNIVPIFGVGQHEGYHFIVMQYIRGVGLDAILRELQRLLLDTGVDGEHASCKSPSNQTRESIDALSIARSLATITAAPGSGGSRPEDEPIGSPSAERPSRSASTPTTGLGPAYWHSVARIVLQAADALEYAHRQGTLHRDIKPGNLLIDADETVWVADFGLAKAMDQQGVTRTGDVVGTLRYMAPEQFKGQYDARSEVYSLGLTLYELATLRPAFAETGKTTLIDAIARGHPKAPRQLCPHLPRDLETVILKSTASDPDTRYVSAGTLADDLRCFVEDRPIQARRATAVERLQRWSR
ncbi:MAG: serine/threonine protein kinase, partial [bacterium]|nr:serine/threonine protein kinase [bacterium]